MKYLIVHLLKGDVEKYVQSISEELDCKFNIGNVCNRVEPHLTLKAPFEILRIEEIEKILEDISSNFKVSKFSVSGFNNFNKRVLFLDIVPNLIMKNVQEVLISELRKIKDIDFAINDGEEIRYHATIGRVKRNFNEIWNFLKQKEKPKFESYFDNISILKKVEGKWILHKEFRLKSIL